MEALWIIYWGDFNLQYYFWHYDGNQIQQNKWISTTPIISYSSLLGFYLCFKKRLFINRSRI